MFQGCLNGSLGVFQGCFKDVLRVFQGCLKDVSRVSQVSKVFSSLFQRCLMSV